MRLVPPPLWALFALAATYGLSLAPGLSTLPLLQTRPAGLIVVVAALALLFTAMIQFRLANTQLLPTSAANNALVTNGVFAFTRNPMYLGMAAVHLGLALGLGSIGGLIGLAFAVVAIQTQVIMREEAYMATRFGADYDRYRQQVRRWL